MWRGEKEWCRTWPRGKGADWLAGAVLLHAPRLSGGGENRAKHAQVWLRVKRARPRRTSNCRRAHTHTYTHTGDDGVSRARVVDACRMGWGEREGGRKRNWARMNRDWANELGEAREGPTGGGCRRARGGCTSTKRLGSTAIRYLKLSLITFHSCVGARYAHGTTAAPVQEDSAAPAWGPEARGPEPSLGAQPLKLR